MAVTYGQIQASTLKLIDEFSSRGATQAETKIADYKYKIQSVTNDTIYELASTTAKLPKSLLIPHNPIKNTYSDDTSTIKQHIPGTDFSIELTNAKSCFFEVTYPGRVIIEESNDGVIFTTLENIDVPNGSPAAEFAEYKRLITPSSSTTIIRLRFTGDYVYLFRNYILYPYSWPTENDVQQHRPWWVLDVPDDFLDLNYVEVKKDQGQYIPYSEMIATPDRKISFNSYDAPSEFLVHYWRKPSLLSFTGTTEIDEAQVIDLRDDAALIIPYNNAGIILNSEDSENGKKGNWCLTQYMRKKEGLIPATFSRPGTINNVYSW